MRQIARNKLGIKIWINEEEILPSKSYDFSNLVEIVKDHSGWNRNICRTHCLHSEVVSHLMQQCHQFTEAIANMFGHFSMKLIKVSK